MSVLQWGGRFAAAPDAGLLAFGSSLEEDLVLAPFDVRCSMGHLAALIGAGVFAPSDAMQVEEALRVVQCEIEDGRFARWARDTGAEDVHGAIDARVRELAPHCGERLHAGRSRNDQVATTLLLYVRDRADKADTLCRAIGRSLLRRASAELDAGTLLAGTTHRQPAQPVLLAFVLVAWTEPLLRAAHRFGCVARNATRSCPLGSAALAGSTLVLDRAAAAAALGFEKPARNALDAIGNRDAGLDLAEAFVRTSIDISRICEELILWCTPAFGFVRLDDRASTGSSLMPQKRNPDPFELLRAHAATTVGAYAGALATLCGLSPSYQRDLQQTKAQIVAIAERSLRALDAFARAWDATSFVRGAMNARAGDHYTVATDVADAAIAAGSSARAAHAAVGAVVSRAESLGRPLDRSDLGAVAAALGVAPFDAPLDARASVEAKRTCGSTSPACVREQIAELSAALAP